MLTPNDLFDEGYYLLKNPDVAAAVANGIVASGLDHFLALGAAEGRKPSAFFDSNYYLAENPDLADEISPEFTVFDHFVRFGQFEGRSPTPFFNPNWYRIKYPDVEAAVERDELTGFFAHFIEFGAAEGRSPSPVYRQNFYLERNPDIAAAVGRDELTGIEHFLVFGAREGRSASEVFNPTFYRNIYDDVAQAVDAGALDSGVEHFLRFGRNEGRDSLDSFALPAPTGPFPVDMTTYFFTDASRPEIFTADADDVRELSVDVWYPGMAASVPTAPTLAPPEPYLNPLLEAAIAPQQNLPPNFYDLINTNTASIPLTVSDTQPNYPVLLFSHGLGALPEFYTSFLQNLASHGYIVAAIDHTYVAGASGFPDGEITQFALDFLPTNPAELEGALLQTVEQTTQDVRFILDRLTELNAADPTGVLTGKLDLSRAGMFGHSFGGITTTAVLQQEPRLQAGASMDGLLISPDLVDPIAAPFMQINAERTFKDSFLGQLLGGADSLFRPAQFELLFGPAVNLSIQGTRHSDFSDRSVLFPLTALYSPEKLGLPGVFDIGLTDIGPIEGDRPVNIINEYLRSFFDRYLKNQPSPLLAGAPPFPEVQVTARNVV